MEDRIGVEDFKEDGSVLTDSFVEWYTKGSVKPEDFIHNVFLHLCGHRILLRGKHYRHLYEETLDYLTRKQLVKLKKDPDDAEEYKKMRWIVEEVCKIYVECCKDELVSKNRDEFEHFLAMRHRCWQLSKKEEA